MTSETDDYLAALQAIYCEVPPTFKDRLSHSAKKKLKIPRKRSERKAMRNAKEAACIYKAENQEYFDILGQHIKPDNLLAKNLQATYSEYVRQNDGDTAGLSRETDQSIETMLCNVMHCVKLLQFLPMSFRGNEGMMSQIITKHGWIALQFASIEIRSNKEFILLAVIQNEDAICIIPLCLRDKDIVFAAAIKNKHLLKYAPIALQKDKEFIKKLITYNVTIFDHYFNRFKDDKEVILLALQFGVLLYNIPKELIDDYDIAYAVVEKNGYNLSLFSENIRKNKPIVLRAIVNYGRAYDLASKELQADNDVILVAFTNGGICIKCEKGTRQFPVARNITSGGKYLAPVAILYDTIKIRSFTIHIRDIFIAQQAIRTISRKNTNQTAVRLINGHGPYFANIFKWRIASFLGVPDIYGLHIGSDIHPKYIDYWQLFNIAFKEIFSKK